MYSLLLSSELKEIIYKLIDNKIDGLIIYNDIFKDITNEEFNKILTAIKINKSLKSLKLKPNCSDYFDDFPPIKNDSDIIKPYKTFINMLNSKNNINLLELDHIYHINTLYTILKNNFKYDVDISFRCCKMKYLPLLIEYLKNHKNKIHLKLDIFEYNYYINGKNKKIFQRYKYYYNNFHYMCFLKNDELYQEYSLKERHNITKNYYKYIDLFNNVILESMNTIIDDLEILVNFLKIYNNITITIDFQYMFRYPLIRDNINHNIQIFNDLFYKKYGEEIKNNILFKN